MNNHMKCNSIHLVVLIITALSPYFVHGQPAEGESKEGLTQAIVGNMTVVVSSDGINAMPEFVLYRTIFEQIIYERRYAEMFNTSDRAQILKLPSYTNRRFTNISKVNDAAICQRLDKAREGSVAYELLAEEFEVAKNDYRNKIGQYYKQFVSNLSEDAQLAIENLKDDIAKTETLSFADINLIGIAEASPEFADVLLDRFCLAAKRNIDDDARKAEFLIEEREHAKYFPLSNVRN